MSRCSAKAGLSFAARSSDAGRSWNENARGRVNGMLFSYGPLATKYWPAVRRRGHSWRLNKVCKARIIGGGIAGHTLAVAQGLAAKRFSESLFVVPASLVGGRRVGWPRRADGSPDFEKM